VTWRTVFTTSPGWHLAQGYRVSATEGYVIVDSLPRVGPAIPPTEIFHTTDAGSTWTSQFKTSNTYKVNAASFSDPSHGWLVGDSLALKTTNAGVTWTPIVSTTFPARIDSKAVFAINTNNVWIATDLDGKQNILHSGNGGSSWDIQQINVPSSIFCLFFQ